MQRKDEDQIRQVIERWEEAWNAHDMAAMATLVCDDADFVNVWGMHWRGRTQVEREHAERHRGQFRESVWTTREARVQFLRPDVALVHLGWRMAGGRDPDGTPRPPREGLFTWIMLKEPGKWRIRAAHNTNVAPPK
jgi:uncharacterized protein (TIGR02246 family)